MIYCRECGFEMPDDSKFCSNCGTPVISRKKSKAKIENTHVPTDTGGLLPNVNTTYGRGNLEKLPEGYEIDHRYTVIRKLGQGGFGAVYQVYDKEMDVDKALKIIPEAISNDHAAMASLRKEAAIMVKLNHKSIVRVYDLHHTGDIKYIDMEYVEGESLADLKLEKPDIRFSEKEVKKYVLQVAEGLAYAHIKKVIHKDIKPQNIMLTKEGIIKLMDFGIAETVHNSMSRLKNTGSSGTLVYMSPEQLRGKGVGKEADIYSLGATLYELLSGNPPFYAGDITYQIINEKPEPIKGISQQMNAIVLKCLEKDRDKRFTNCEELHKALSGWQAETENDFIKMVFVKRGTFQMGSNNGYSNEKPIHTVTVDDFYIGKYEVTQKQWKSIMGNNPSYFKGDDLPVESVSWNEVQEFIKKLNQKTGKHYRLPTEAEWEYAARGGIEAQGGASQTTYAGSNNIDEVAWYSGSKTHAVGTKQPNALGIYDMSGNVWEWCNDWYGSDYYKNSPRNNPQGPGSGTNRVNRGGSWIINARICRVAYRNNNSPGNSYIGMGFRLVFVP